MLVNSALAAFGRAIVYMSLFAAAAVYAEEAPQEHSAAAEQHTAGQAAWRAAQAAMLHGPQEVQLVDQAKLTLPEGYGFIPKQQAAAVMKAMGNRTNDRFLGLIFPDTQAEWFATVHYEPSGYIEDSDAKDWDADELLNSLKEGTKEGNKERQRLNITPIEVTHWVEVPAYDSPQHRLVWSAEVREIGGHDPDPTINYNTYVLGREGYISLNLITSSSQIDKDRTVARQLLAGVQFNDGKRYADFNKATDKVASYGLAALVGGLALKKLGLLGMAGVFLAKFAKLILIGLAALGGIVAKMFKRRERQAV